MSLTIALKGTDGLVLAADSRVTKGYTLDGPKTRDNSKKFIRLNDDCGVLTYGISDVGNSGITVLQQAILKYNNNHSSMSPILEKGIMVFKSVSSEWTRKNPEVKRRDKDVGFIIAGINRIEKGFEIYNFQSPEFIPKRVGSGSLLAGQWHIAKFFVNRLYTENMRVDKLTELAALLLNETMAVEKTVGGAIRLATITNTKGFQWVLEAEVKSIIKKNELFRKFFKKHFHSSLMSAVNNDRE